jgi:hypothetical protein
MPRIATEEVAQKLAQRMVNRGHDASKEWLAAWCRRWGAQVAKDTASNPLHKHKVEEVEDSEPVVVLGRDRVPLDLYREWKDLQDGSRTIRGTPDGSVFWEG